MRVLPRNSKSARSGPLSLRERVRVRVRESRTPLDSRAPSPPPSPKGRGRTGVDLPRALRALLNMQNEPNGGLGKRDGGRASPRVAHAQNNATATDRLRASPRVANAQNNATATETSSLVVDPHRVFNAPPHAQEQRPRRRHWFDQHGLGLPHAAFAGGGRDHP